MLLAECMVCLGSLETTKDIYAAPCGHVLHYSCWAQWFQTSACCPQCRRSTDMSYLIKLYINYTEKEDTETMRNKILALECDLSCKAVECETAVKDLRDQMIENGRLQNLKKTVVELSKVTESVNMEVLEKCQQEVETLKHFKDQSEEIKKLKADFEKSKKEVHKQTRNRSNEEIDIIRRYQGVIEVLKKCLAEFDQMKKSYQLVKKLKIFTDDITCDVKIDVIKDPEKYAEMFLEVKKFWDVMEKREDEIPVSMMRALKLVIWNL